MHKCGFSTVKSVFPEFYSPTEDEYNSLWSEATIVLDTNVLLDLYRLPESAQNDLLNLFEYFESRIWIPHQVALEFQRNRLKVMASERKSTEDVISGFEKYISEIKSNVELLQLDKRILDVNPDKILEKFYTSGDELKGIIAAVHVNQPDISSIDNIRERIDRIFNGKIGAAPAGNNDIEALVRDGDARYSSKIPPGFADAEKSKVIGDEFFVHGGVRYEKKFGDLILWRQIISYAKSNDIKYVLFITSDKKEDWFWREKGKTIGPHPELINEIRREANVSRFWIYQTAQFVEHSKKYTNTSISEKSVNEIKNVQHISDSSYILGSKYARLPLVSELAIEADLSRDVKKLNYSDESDSAIRRWICGFTGIVDFQESLFPDYIATVQGIKCGFEIKRIPNINDRKAIHRIRLLASNGRSAVSQRRISHLTIIVLIDPAEYHLYSEDEKRDLSNNLDSIVENYRNVSIVYGYEFAENFFAIAQHGAGPTHV